ncbi:MAG: DUF2723 domain-containing protein [Anaerolineae bacterium]|nr:DUF2723 domain-containing protein [Anaerolineae bacterium]
MNRSPYLISVFTALVALLVYGRTLSPDLTWANFSSDGGELITAAVTWGVPHPPGYPTYVLLGHMVSWLPVGTVALRFNLLSALCVAGAVGLVTAVNYQFVAGDELPTTNANIAVVVAGLTFAFAPLVWGRRW